MWRNLAILLPFLILASHVGLNTGAYVEAWKDRDGTWSSSSRSSKYYKYPFLDPSLPWDDRVDDLVGRLTLDELVNQTITLYSIPTFGVPRLGVRSYVWITECLRGVGGTYGTAFPQALGLAAMFR